MENEQSSSENQNEQENIEAGRTNIFDVHETTDWQANTTLIEPNAKHEGTTAKADTKEESDDDTNDEEESDDEVADTGADIPQVDLIADPGEYQPKDYSFTITLADGKTVTVRSFEQAEEIGDDPENFETPKQLLDFVHKAQKMKNQLEKDEEEYQQKKAEFDEQQTIIENISREQNRIIGEFEYLVENGDLPKLPSNAQKLDWRAPENRNKPGIKEHLEIIRFMERESKKREAKGLTPLTSPIDAFAAYQVAKAKKSKAESNKQAGEQRRANGSRVAGSSPSPVGYAPKGIAVGRVGNLRSMGAGWDT